MNPCVIESLEFSGSAVDLLDIFKQESFVFFLDSSQAGAANSRYSILGFDPFKVVRASGRDALDILKKEFSVYAYQEDVSGLSRGEVNSRIPGYPSDRNGLPLMAGIAGYLSYDFGRGLELKKRRPRENTCLVPDVLFCFYDCLLVLDHAEGRLYVTSTGLPQRDGFLKKQRADSRLRWIKQRLDGVKPGARSNPLSTLEKESYGEGEISFACNLTKEQYLTAVQRALNYIAQGDIYQVNLSQRFTYDCQGRDVDIICLYKTLRRLSPSSFGGYFNAGDFQILSSSPERFLCLRNGLVQTKPMKGTRPRAVEADLDRKMREELIHSSKDKAELLMITDLERNDLGKVCRYGSVSVKEMRQIETYQTVYQATSTVEGFLKEGTDAFDLLKACFPGGSITGCPKIRAMEIIDELEPAARGIYTGSLGYISFNGDMDFNILIRSILSCQGKLYFQTGSGIVADSLPLEEYEETLVKAKAMRQAIHETIVLSGRAYQMTGASAARR